MKGCCKDIQANFKIDNDHSNAGKIIVTAPLTIKYFKVFSSSLHYSFSKLNKAQHIFFDQADIPYWGFALITFFCTYLI